MLNKLRQKSLQTRKRIALGASSGILFLIFFSWVYVNGFLGYSQTIVVEKNTDSTSQTTQVAISDKTDNSPLDNTKSAFGVAFSELGKQYNDIKNSISSVLVPFITGIDVYQKSR